MKTTQVRWAYNDYLPAPIPFVKVSNGVYLSKCGRFRITKEERTGYGSGNTTGGRVHWHVTILEGVYAKRNPLSLRRHSHSLHSLSLEDAIAELHTVIARGFTYAFEVLAEWRKEQEREQAAALAHEQKLRQLANLIDGWACLHLSTDEYVKFNARSLAEYLEGDKP